MRYALVFMFTIMISTPIFSQKYLALETFNVDSLQLVLPYQQGIERINTLNWLAHSLSYEDYDSGKKYGEEAMSLAIELDYQEGIARAHNGIGFVEVFQGNYPEALNHVIESLRIYEKMDQKNNVAKMNYIIAACHYLAGNHEKVIEYCKISLEKYRECHETSVTAGSVRDTILVISLLTESCTHQGLKEEALEYTLQFYKVAEANEFGITERMLWTFLVGAHYYMNGENDSASIYFKKALAFPDVNQDIQALKYRPLSFLGYMHHEAGDFDTAILYLQTALEWYEKNGFLYWALEASNTMGWCYFKNDQMIASEKFFKRSERIFDEMLLKNSWFRHDSLKYIVSYGIELYFPLATRYMQEMMWKEGISLYYMLFKIYDINGRTPEALKYHISYSDAVDTLDVIERSRETIELQTMYESESKDRQISTLFLENELKESRLMQTRYFLIGSAGLFILLMMIGYILFRQNKLKADQQKLILQQRLFRSQMNPHFIFNSLASIQNFIVKQDSKKANIFLSRFSDLVRSILDNSTREYITFEKEIKTIRNYLELQKVRYIETLDYSIDIDETIDKENMKIPPMLAQPIIENAIEHGIKYKEDKGKVKVRFKLNLNTIIFEVEDDGVGREKAMEMMLKQDKGHQSLATSIARERIQILNKKLKQKISFQIIDLKNEMNKPVGTLVTFKIPVIF